MVAPSCDTTVWWQFARRSGGPALTARSGKWLIYAHTRDVDALWATIKRATQRGQLGTISKCATRLSARCSPLSRDPQTHVICCYSADGADDARVAAQAVKIMRILAAQNLPRPPLYWKADIDTEQGLYPPDERTIAAYSATLIDGVCRVRQLRAPWSSSAHR